MMAIAAGVAMLSAYLGFVGSSRYINIEPAGLMAAAGGGLFFLAVLFSPRYGIVSTLVRNLQTSVRIIREDILAMLYRLEELGVSRRMGPREAVLAVGGTPAAALALWSLFRQRGVSRSEGGLELTAAGRDQATHLIRSHRLWEAYLVEYLGLPLDHVHAPAERMEHYIGPALQKEIAQRLGDDRTDPHGREIP